MAHDGNRSAAIRRIALDEVPDAMIIRGTDAIVKVTASCVCGSVLWPYRGTNEMLPCLLTLAEVAQG